MGFASKVLGAPVRDAMFIDLAAFARCLVPLVLNVDNIPPRRGGVLLHRIGYKHWRLTARLLR